MDGVMCGLLDIVVETRDFRALHEVRMHRGSAAYHIKKGWSFRSGDISLIIHPPLLRDSKNKPVFV
jgi:hypothetical protein